MTAREVKSTEIYGTSPALDLFSEIFIEGLRVRLKGVVVWKHNYHVCEWPKAAQQNLRLALFGLK